MKVPYVDLAFQHQLIKKELLDAVDGVLNSGQFILGPEVTEFERQFVLLSGSAYALAVHSGTDALILALRVLDLKPGDEVITVANSFVTTASAIIAVGAKPVFVDVKDDYTIDPALVAKAITKKTKAILPVHLTGKPCAMGELVSLAQKHKLHIIEDCAQAVGATYKKKNVGSFGVLGCFSLHPLKTLNACGDGGVIVTDDAKLYQRLKILRENGLASPNECVAWSGNSRLDTIQAAILLVKLKYLHEWTKKRIEYSRIYQKKLSQVRQVRVPVDKSDERAVYHTFVIEAEKRDALKEYLEANGVGTKIHYAVPIHLQPTAKNLGYKKGSLPVTERQAGRILSLPIYHHLTEEQLDYVVSCIADFYRGKV